MDNFNVNSDESEGAFNEFIEDQMEDIIEGVLNTGDLEEFGDRSSDVIIEMDDIVVPTFSYGDEEGGGGGQGNGGPGDDKGKLRFSLPFERVMELIAAKLRLPNLLKDSKGKIKELTFEFKTFGTTGVLLDKKRTFKRALKSSIGTEIYQPDKGKFEVLIKRKDRRFKVPERIEKPKFNAVVFYMGDISYSTYGDRLKLEKRLVNFIHHWLDYNYGKGNVEHRFFVHDADAYEVQPADFYNVTNIGGTRAAPVFDLVSQIAFNEYDTSSTNFYGFYFGDGELFDDDAKKILDILGNQMREVFNRIGIVEVQPSQLSMLNKKLVESFYKDSVIRISDIKEEQETVDVIKKLFSNN